MIELVEPLVAILFVFGAFIWTHVEVDGVILSKAGIGWAGAKRKKEKGK